MAGVYMMKAENVSKERPISFGIFTVDDYMGAIDHRSCGPRMLNLQGKTSNHLVFFCPPVNIRGPARRANFWRTR
jgi:hypothetical protein